MLNPLGGNSIRAGRVLQESAFLMTLSISVFHGALNPIRERLFGKYTTTRRDEREMVLTMVDVFHVEMQGRHEYSHRLGALVA